MAPGDSATPTSQATGRAEPAEAPPDPPAPDQPAEPEGSIAPAGGAGADRPWFPSSAAFWEPIPAGSPTDPLDESVHRLLIEPGGNKVANLISFAVPIVEWDPAVNGEPLTVTETGHEAWGFNVLSSIGELSVSSNTEAAPGSDGKLVVLDRRRNQVIDLWVAHRTERGWSARWGGVYALDGDGTSRFPAYQGPNSQDYPLPVSRGTGSGISSLAGLVTIDDIRSGSIDHALVFATDRACGPPLSEAFRWPATATDGWVEGDACIPEGGRLQLDPEIDVEALDLSPGQTMVAHALQTYGAYCIDNGGSRVGLIFELAADQFGTDVYAMAGMSGDYASMNELPWGEVRLVAVTTAP